MEHWTDQQFVEISDSSWCNQ